jgi:iron complex outermembrane recepter protein
MLRSASLAVVAATLIPFPALAGEERTAIDVPATRLDNAVRSLGRQSGASIGFRDAKVAKLRVRAIRGRYTAGEALYLMLQDSGARARRVAADTFLIEADPDFGKRTAAPAPARAPSRIAEVTPAAPAPPPVEIVVTGTKRDIPIAAYPGMVHVIDGNRISVASGRMGSDALESATPSVVSTHLGPGRNKLFIRGIADSSFVGPTQSTVGQYWGNSRITYSAPDPSLKLYDVGRIEVLEGPQGTLYGAGSLGGIVRVVPRAPQLDAISGSTWAGVEAVQHGKPGYDGGAVLNLPIVTDQLGLRVLAFGTTENGYIDDVKRNMKDVNDVSSIGGRIALRYEPTTDITVDLGVVGQRIDGADSQYAERAFGRLKRSSNLAQPFRNDFLLSDLVLRKTWAEIELTASFGLAHQEVTEDFEGRELRNIADAALEPKRLAEVALYSQKNQIDMYTGEIRLARSSADGTGWLIGASVLRNESEVDRSVAVEDTLNALTGVRNRVLEGTVYGELTVAPTPQVNLTFGARGTASRISGAVLDPVLPLLIYELDPGAKASRTESRFLPSLALAYRPTAKMTVFARYQEGFRPGGIAIRREYVQRYDGDRVRTIEAGLRFRSEAVELETSASWTGWRDIQADIIDGFGFPTTTNVGNGTVGSFGISGRWRPLPGFELDGALYLNHSRVTQRNTILDQVDSQTSGAAQFNRLPNIADETARVGFAWSTFLSDTRDLEITGFGRYVGESVLGIGPILGKLQGEYIDTGMEVSLRAGPVRYSLSASNLFDARGNRFALGSPFQIRTREQITPLQPRSIRFGIQFDF